MATGAVVVQSTVNCDEFARILVGIALEKRSYRAIASIHEQQSDLESVGGRGGVDRSGRFVHPNQRRPGGRSGPGSTGFEGRHSTGSANVVRLHECGR